MLIAGAATGVVEGMCGRRLWEWEVHGERGEGLVVAAADILRGMQLLRCKSSKQSVLKSFQNIRYTYNWNDSRHAEVQKLSDRLQRYE